MSVRELSKKIFRVSLSLLPFPSTDICKRLNFFDMFCATAAISYVFPESFGEKLKRVGQNLILLRMLDI